MNIYEVLFGFPRPFKINPFSKSKIMQVSYCGNTVAVTSSWRISRNYMTTLDGRVFKYSSIVDVIISLPVRLRLPRGSMNC